MGTGVLSAQFGQGNSDLIPQRKTDNKALTNQQPITNNATQPPKESNTNRNASAQDKASTTLERKTKQRVRWRQATYPKPKPFKSQDRKG